MPSGIYKHKKGYKRPPFSGETKKKMSKSKMGHFVSEETKRKIGLVNKGKEFSKETRKKLSESQEGYHNSPDTEFKKGHSPSKESRKKMSLAMIGKYVGDKNPSWKGGVTPLHKLIRHSFKNRQWISDVFTRDNFICQRCGYDKGRILNAHHIKGFSRIMEEYKIETYEDAMDCEELWNINNGITLCEKCHIAVHKNNEWTEEKIKELCH